MKLYRFSPIETKDQLLEAINYIHASCHELSKLSFDKYLPTSGNIGIFCHYDSECENLKEIQKELCDMSDGFNNKYFKLKEPITIQAKENVPETTYTYLA